MQVILYNFGISKRISIEVCGRRKLEKPKTLTSCLLHCHTPTTTALTHTHEAGGIHRKIYLHALLLGFASCLEHIAGASEVTSTPASLPGASTPRGLGPLAFGGSAVVFVAVGYQYTAAVTVQGAAPKMRERILGSNI